MERINQSVSLKRVIISLFVATTAIQANTITAWAQVDKGAPVYATIHAPENLSVANCRFGDCEAKGSVWIKNDNKTKIGIIANEGKTDEATGHRTLSFIISAVTEWDVENKRVDNYNQDLDTLAVNIRLFPAKKVPKGATIVEISKLFPNRVVPANGPIPEYYDSTPFGDEIKVLAITPTNTAASTAPTQLGQTLQVAGALGEALSGGATKLALGGAIPARGSESIENLLSASEGSISIKPSGLGNVLGDLNAPRLIPNQYGYIADPQTFGWRFRQNLRDKPPSLLLGVHPTAVTFEMKPKAKVKAKASEGDPKDDSKDDSEIDAIGIEYTVLSRWKHKDANGSEWLKWTQTTFIPQPDRAETEEKKKNEKEKAKKAHAERLPKLVSLEDQPILIPLEDAALIFNATSKYAMKTFKNNPNKYVTGGETVQPLKVINGFITRTSIEEFLGLKRPEEKVLKVTSSVNPVTASTSK